MEFRDVSKPESETASTTETRELKTTPEEAIESAHQGLREQLAAELLSRILGCSPTFYATRFDTRVVLIDGKELDRPFMHRRPWESRLACALPPIT